jgi:hypothetical protein
VRVLPALTLLLALPARGDGGPSAPDGDGEGVPRPQGTPPVALSIPLETQAAEQAVERALEFLAAAQERAGDGSFASPRTRFGEKVEAPVGITALCTLTFLAAGNAPGRGPHGAVVERAVDYLLLHTDLSENSRRRGYVSAQGDGASRAHGHGYATLALAEAYGTGAGSQRVREALIAAVRHIERCQGSEGGWYYEPYPEAQHEGSVTICMLQALRAARNAGIQVDPGCIRRAEDYVRRLQGEDGRFRYALAEDAPSSIALTAAGIATLNAIGRYDDPAVARGVDALWTGLFKQDQENQEVQHAEYQRLYLAQAFWQLSDTSHFERWFPEERARLLRTQRTDGSWKGSMYGDCYPTAVNCLVLLLPEGLLPIFQR